MDIIMHEIGHIKSPYNENVKAPHQGFEVENSIGKLILNEEYLEGMYKMKKGNYYAIIFCFNQSQGYSLKLQGRNDDGEETGLFNTRCPRRPNPIGVSLVKVLDINENIITFSGCDMLDGSPVLDIKPLLKNFTLC
ncbi:tRNA-Thr(GGU) m(6)t(6)A37 methyltransferase TsaA [Acetitomaculum ruminis DSM 5522]|uniref:tRNA-Thr(GGU) m(6)t(6)A37 methyltransferase TsaA n=1 Tax=Acetitomaculum ruminis DSM 5522 TaxID=1120918 RepID=A0A1I0XAR7_9FIRM|nr:tRNA (N6-threonylcarbamoyladenosine(37)-N6)-methyltransferase TrmO [Acetitomaculum ruminis]SFA98169.1 tRNA-Thr(GGU) m(6)t(6)A37 methyltransferase TsaA [Acetitomaculum ruminis DSM 5522]